MRSEDLRARYLAAVGLLSGATVLLLGFRILLTGTTRYWFVPENLALAWLSLLFAWLLVKGLKARRWLSWQNLGLSVLWLVFFPNTWYVLTDFIHVYPTGEISQLFDIVLIGLMVGCGFMLGIGSLFMVHRELMRRLSQRRSYLLVELAILGASFAVYLGRDLRWNSWDVIKDPGGLLVNVSDSISDPLGSPRAINVTLLFFILVSVVYLAFWIFTRPPAKSRR